ncbi:hypothetical protein [Streptomyces corynorhini]|uniref:Uncharacterized protein n=1 Tax=Streptomyces corynorhini TaxID=2282652 RepID=A0A370ATV5_9ACTN|nr:hypothetical protein [Streptomyces corynorhini]RDG30545.1 hypothetical protein DVH02_34080 [Streptomyces corynorhini]
MPAPERASRPQSEPQPRQQSSAYLSRELSPSSVPMKDLLASCAAARAVSTPPCPPSAVAVADEAARREAADVLRRDAA